MARRRRGLTPEERELWSRVTRTTEALHPSGKTIDPLPKSIARPDTKSEAKPPALPRFRIGQFADSPSKTTHSKAPDPAERLAESSLRMDHKIYKRMTQGRLRPEARLDLHGMTLAAAQPELVRFILSCHANGLRLVLVITGKGRGEHGPLPTRPGALRHQVPHWLHRMPLTGVVQQVTAAHYRHGGEGAYYVYLRK